MSSNVPIYAVDFDGTLCESKWPEIGAPNTKLIEWLKQRQSEGAKVILWTCRIEDRLKEAVDWCAEHGLMFDAVNDNLPENIEKYGNNCRKIWATCYIDDLSADKEAFNLPFRTDEYVVPYEKSEVERKYPVGSLWTLKLGSKEMLVRVKMIELSDIFGRSMTVEYVAVNPDTGEIETVEDFRHTASPEWFYDKLFPFFCLARGQENE